MSETTFESPTAEERAKFFVTETVKVVGYGDMLKSATGESVTVPSSPGVESSEEAVENLEMSFYDGVRRQLQNKREIGWSPLNAWNACVGSKGWPLWVKRALAEQEHETFSGSDPEFWSDEEEEYVDYLEETYDVPQ